METTKFQHFPKGIDELGAIVEVCVKITKQSIFKSIHKNIPWKFQHCCITEYSISINLQ